MNRAAPSFVYVIGIIMSLILMACGISCAYITHYLTVEAYPYIYHIIFGVSAANFFLGAILFIACVVFSISDSEYGP